MESSKIFYQQTYELKNKIYKKYSFKFDDIKDIIYDALVNIYGKKYSKNIKQKLNSIVLVNYFSSINLMNKFITSSDRFIPKIIDPTKEKDELEKKMDELDQSYSEIFGPDSLKLNKNYDEDVIEYIDFASTYSTNLYKDYIKESDFSKLSDTDLKNKDYEYDLNTSFYSCCILELSKYNLLLEKDLLYKNLTDNFYITQTKLIHNVTKDSKKCDIIIINPLQFNENSFLDLITNIVSSVNTDLNILEDGVFEFSRGLNDNFIKQNFSAEPEYDKKYMLFTDYINQNLALEVLNYIQNHEVTIWNYSNFPIKDFAISRDLYFNAFFSYHKRKILDAIITKDNNILFEVVGEENFLSFMELTFQSIQETSNVYSNLKKSSKSEKKNLHNRLLQIEQLLRDMKKYSKNGQV